MFAETEERTQGQQIQGVMLIQRTVRVLLPSTPQATPLKIFLPRQLLPRLGLMRRPVVILTKRQLKPQGGLNHLAFLSRSVLFRVLEAILKARPAIGLARIAIGIDNVTGVVKEMVVEL